MLPDDEAERLQSLRYYDILHSLHEPVFDKFVALTARIFGLPISLIALVDETEVHYPANHGMPGNPGQPREEALCSTAILHNKAVVFQDLAAAEAPAITTAAAREARAKQLRFYAAAPLRMPDQRNIGALCVIDREPRPFSLGERHLLEELADLVSRTVAVRHECRRRTPDGERQWLALRAQLAEELQALRALVRYLFVRQGPQVPVPPEQLAQVSRRLHDLHEVLDQPPGQG